MQAFCFLCLLLTTFQATSYGESEENPAEETQAAHNCENGYGNDSSACIPRSQSGHLKPDCFMNDDCESNDCSHEEEEKEEAEEDGWQPNNLTLSIGLIGTTFVKVLLHTTDSGYARSEVALFDVKTKEVMQKRDIENGLNVLFNGLTPDATYGITLPIKCDWDFHSAITFDTLPVPPEILLVEPRNNEMVLHWAHKKIKDETSYNVTAQATNGTVVRSYMTTKNHVAISNIHPGLLLFIQLSTVSNHSRSKSINITASSLPAPVETILVWEQRKSSIVVYWRTPNDGFFTGFIVTAKGNDRSQYSTSVLEHRRNQTKWAEIKDLNVGSKYKISIVTVIKYWHSARVLLSGDVYTDSKKFKVKMTFFEDFKNSLRNPYGNFYWSLCKNLTKEFESFFQPRLHGFQRVVVKGYAKGSIIAYVRMHFVPSSNVTSKQIKDVFKQIPKTMAGLRISKDILIEEVDKDRSHKGPHYKIPLTIACGVSFCILVVVTLGVWAYFRNSFKEENNPMEPQEKAFNMCGNMPGIPNVQKVENIYEPSMQCPQKVENIYENIYTLKK